MNTLERFPQSLRSILGLSLILVFLGLGSCRAQKGFQALLQGTFGKAQAQQGTGPGKHFVAKTCHQADPHTTLKLQLPGRTLTLPPPPLLPYFPLSPFGFEPFLLPGRENVSLHQLQSPVFPGGVPVYLRNRSLLI